MDESLNNRLEHQIEDLLVALRTIEEPHTISLFDWHRHTGHRSMKTMVGIANGAAKCMVPKDIPGDFPSLDTCHPCVLTKSQLQPFKTRRIRAIKPLELIHGDLVGLISLELVSRCLCGFVLIDDYSRASWVLSLRANPDAPVEFGKWATMMQNGT